MNSHNLPAGVTHADRYFHVRDEDRAAGYARGDEWRPPADEPDPADFDDREYD